MRVVITAIVATLCALGGPATASDTYAQSAATCHTMPQLYGSVGVPTYAGDGIYNDSTSTVTQFYCAGASEWTSFGITSVGIDFCSNSTASGHVSFPVIFFDWQGLIIYTVNGAGSGIGCYHEDVSAPGLYGHTMMLSPILPVKNGNGVNKLISFTVEH